MIDTHCATNPEKINIKLEDIGCFYDEESADSACYTAGVSKVRREVEVIYYVTKTYAIDSAEDVDELLPNIREIVFNEDFSDPGDSTDGERFDYIDVGDVYLDGERITSKI